MIKRPLAAAALGAALVLAGLVLLRPQPYEDYGEIQGKTLTVTGRVYKKETAVNWKGEETPVLYVKLETAGAIGKTASGPDRSGRKADTGPPGEHVICYLKSGQKEPEIGSWAALTGKAAVFERASNPGQFDAYSYYQISGISYRLNQAIVLAKSEKYNKLGEAGYRLRLFLSQKLKQCLPKEEASLMQTMLLGEKSGMDRELKALYQRNGIAHILAISGLHISMLGMGLYKLLRKCSLPMKASAVISTLVIIFYGMMTGFSVSALRAVFMFALQMISILTERTYDMLTAAALSAVLIILQQPLYLFHSGFVFSFGCVLGIGLLFPVLVQSKDDQSRIRKALLGGLGMAVINLPIYLWFYYQYPVYSVFLNLLVLPLMSLLMAAGLMLLLSQTFFPFLSLPFIFFVRAVLKIYEGACRVCDRMPGNLWTPGKPRIYQIFLYLLLMLALVFYGKKLGFRVRWCIAALAAALFIIQPKGGLAVTFLDVGQGDCIFIENAGEGNYLVDGGSSSVKGVGEYRIIPFLKSQGASVLEAVFVTHPDEDHYSGIRELLEMGREQGIDVRNLVLPDVAEEARTKEYQELALMAGETGVPVAYISQGQEIRNGKLRLACLHPAKGYTGKTNEYSIVLALTYGDFSALLTGDVEGAGERQLINLLQEKETQQRVTVLKAAHHGSAGSTPEELLDCQRPFYTVISCGRGNSYGHPHEELLARLREQDTHIFITYETGAVRVTTNGRKAEVSGYLEHVDSRGQ